MSVALYRNIVQHLTQEKLEELKHQKNSLSLHFLPILQLAQDFSNKKTPIQILTSLFTALSTSPINNIFSKDLLTSVDHLLQNAQDDPALSSSLILDWIALLTTEIRQALRKCEHSFIFASVLTEWLEHEERQQQEQASTTTTTPQSESKLETIAKIQKIMLSNPPDDFNADAFSLFLSENFLQVFKREKAEEEAILKGVVTSTTSYFNCEKELVVTPSDVVNCVNGLKVLKSLAPNKLGVLNDLKANHVAQQEIADLLTNRLTNVESWNWPKNVAMQVVDFRRSHTGEYKPFLNEDIITALLLEYIGQKWASHFKQHLEMIYYSKIWKRVKTVSFNSIENIREGFHKNVFLMALSSSMSFHGCDNDSNNINVNEDYVKIETTAAAAASLQSTSSSLFGAPAVPQPQAFSFSMSAPQQAPTFAGASCFGSSQNSSFLFGCPASSSSATTYSNPNPTLFCGSSSVPQQQQFSTSSFGFSGTNNQVNSFPHPPLPQLSKMDKKQSFLHMLNVEMKLSQVISPPESPLIIVQTEIEDFESSVLHESILVVLQSFGVSSKWIKFFTKFMKVKVSFPGKKEAINHPPDQIIRGLPTAHTLSTVFGEVLMFIFEFLINQHCDGLSIFRFQTELWFWSNDKDKMIKGWEILNGMGKMIGLKIRDTRSGSISILNNPINDLIIFGPVPLPQAEIHWGYLALRSKGIFQINQESITKFVDDMKLLLEKSNCVLQWINIFNKYMAFFIKNFGKTANVAGKQHLDQIVTAVKLIYSQLFGTAGGNPVDALRQKFAILRENQIIDAVVYWPLKLGGFGLMNPLIPVLSLKSSLALEKESDKIHQHKNNENPFKELLDEDKRLWQEKKTQHEKRCEELEKRKMAQAEIARINIGFNNNPVIQVVVNPQLPPLLPPIPEKMETFEEFISKRLTTFLHWYSTYLKMMEIPTAKKFRLSQRLIELQQSYGFQGLKSLDDNTYLAELGNLYETQLVKHFGTLNFVNEKLLPMSMIEKILDADVKFD